MAVMARKTRRAFDHMTGSPQAAGVATLKRATTYGAGSAGGASS